MLAWELIGAVVGAGLASGREIASFFSTYGSWSFIGIILACATMYVLVCDGMPTPWHGSWPEKLWRTLLSMLLIATGGAMLSGAGEIAALTLPFRSGRSIGLVFTLLLSWTLAHRTNSGLAWVSRILMGVLALLIVLGLTLPPMEAVHVSKISIPAALVRGITYGGFNAALQSSILKQSTLPPPARKRAPLAACLGIFLLLLLGNLVLLRHPALLGEEMPFVHMMAAFGLPGYYLGAASLYLAILSTLTACLHGLGNHLLTSAGVVIVSLMGFSGVVERIYPLLGGGCFLMLTAAKFMNCSRKPFISH